MNLEKRRNSLEFVITQNLTANYVMYNELILFEMQAEILF